MIVVLSPRAVQRLREIQAWIAYDNLTAAAQVIQRIRQTTEILADHPKLGPLWRGGPSRGIVVSGLPYRVIYRIDAQGGQIEIVTIAHTSQRPPRG
jgi:addiction module RelE/StbE family toxin